MTDPWHVYIVRCADGILYTGIAKDIKARVKRHNDARGARFTKGRGPVHLIYSERVRDKKDALQREAEIKRLDRKGKEHLASGSGLRRELNEDPVGRHR